MLNGLVWCGLVWFHFFRLPNCVVKIIIGSRCFAFLSPKFGMVCFAYVVTYLKYCPRLSKLTALIFLRHNLKWCFCLDCTAIKLRQTNHFSSKETLHQKTAKIIYQSNHVGTYFNFQDFAGITGYYHTKVWLEKVLVNLACTSDTRHIRFRATRLLPFSRQLQVWGYE